jgi:hypothetical protein
MKRLMFALSLAVLIIGTTFYLLKPVQAQGTSRVFTVLSSASRITTTVSSDFTNLGENLNTRGVYVTLDVTGILTTPNITVSIQAKDYTSGKYENLLTASSGVSSAGTHTYLVYPGVGTASADVTQVASFPLPPLWRVSVAHANTNPITYTVNALLIP